MLLQTVHWAGADYSVTLDPRREMALTVRGPGGPWQFIKREWRPWRLTLADVDGDGAKDIIVALFKSTKYIPQRHNTLFIFGFNGERVVARWQGSTLGRRFTDYAFGSIGGKPKLASIDIRLDGKKTLTLREWNGFGFRFLWEKGAWGSATIVGFSQGAIICNADGKRLRIAP